MSQTTSPLTVPRVLDRTFEGLTWLILGVTPILINVYNVDAYRTVQATFASILIAVAIGCWAIARSLDKNWSEVGKVPMLWIIAAFSAWTLLTVPRSPTPALGLASWWNLVTYLIFWIAIADSVARKPEMRWRLLIPITFGFLANVVMGMMQYKHAPFMTYDHYFPQAQWIGNYFAGLEAPARLGSAAGMLGNQNVLGQYLIGFLPIAYLLGLMLILKRQRMWVGSGLLATALLGSICMIETQTRGAWVGLGIGLVYTVGILLAIYGKTLRRINAKTWIAIGLGVVVIVGGLAWKGHVGVDFAVHKLEQAGTDGTSLERLNAWNVARTMADEKPIFGQGLATYKILYFKYLAKTFHDKPIPLIMHNRYVQAHNDFIQLAGETGWVGFLLGLGLLFGFLGTFSRWFVKQTELDGKDRMLALGGAAGLLSISGSAIFGFPFHIASSSALAVGVAGLAGGIWTQGRRASQPSPELPLYTDAQLAIYHYAMPFAIALLTVAVCWSNWTPYQADKLTKQGQELYSMGRYPEAQAALIQALQLDPTRGDARMMAGLIYAMYGRFSLALHNLKTAERSYDDVTLHYYLGRIYESLKEPKMARAEYHTALHYFPAALPISQAVSQRLYLLDHPASASEELAKEEAAQNAAMAMRAHLLAQLQAQAKARQASLSVR